MTATTTLPQLLTTLQGSTVRYAVAPGPPKWSVHAYGEAIDVNDGAKSLHRRL